MEPYLMSETELNMHNALYEQADEKIEGELAAESMNTGKAAKKHRFSWKKFTANILILALVMTAAVYGGGKYLTMYPYAVTSDDEVICYVDSKETANEAVQKAARDLAEGDSTVVSVSVGDSFNVERADTRDAEVVSADEAADRIIEAARGEEGDPGITVVSNGTEVRTFTPETQYEKDETALAGTTIVKEEAREGKEEVQVTYVTVDGELENTEDISTEVLDEGQPAVIVKGTLGVPDGQDWETYDGSPVFKDGNELVVTAQQYAGKVPYVRGGTSLKTGVDCVGFVRAIYKLYGVNLSAHLKREGYRVSYKNAQPGDILVFQHHYGIYIGNGKMVHAANPRQDVLVSPVSAGTNLQQVRRIPRN